MGDGLSDEVLVRVGDELPPAANGSRRRVTERMARALPLLRAALVTAARTGRTMTYGEASAAVGNAYLPRGMGPLLDAVALDCARRGEPRLDALVVTQDRGEPATGFDGSPVHDRAEVWAHWRR